jgi:hypothetical protein
MKKGVKKAFIYFAVFLAVLMLSGVLADSVGLNLSGEAKKIVDNVIQNKGINQAEVQSVEEVNFTDLPSQVDLGNIDTTNIAVYKVDYGGGKPPLFVLTASDEAIAGYKKASAIVSRVMFLNFGQNGIVANSGFLKTATGVEGSTEKGYVMMRSGSITGLSTNLEVLGGEGSVETIAYLNGEPIGFRNTISTNTTGVKKDYDTQSIGIVNFEKGDVISVYVKSESNIVFSDVINLVEISVE